MLNSLLFGVKYWCYITGKLLYVLRKYYMYYSQFTFTYSGL